MPNISKNQKTILLINQGKLTKAEITCRDLIKKDPLNYINYLDLAIILGMTGRYDESMNSLKKVLETKPSEWNAYNIMGNVLYEKGDLHASIKAYSKALELNNNNAVICNNLGNALRENGDFPEAISMLSKALLLNPHYSVAHNNLGITLQEQGKLDSAIKSYRKALSISPNYPEAWCNLGNALSQARRPADGIHCLKKAIELKPTFAQAYYNLGIATTEAEDFNAAITSYKRALEINPNYPEAHWNLALSLLRTGDYKNGWIEYEWRFKKAKNNAILHSQSNCARWNEKSFRAGNNLLLLIAEQGLGDTIQFMRYVPYLRSLGIRASLCAQPKLHSLIISSSIDTLPLSPEQAKKTAEGNWMPLLSVPKLLNVTPSNPIITKAYIRTSEELLDKWKSNLTAEKKPIIGINWQGKKETEKTGLLGRSLPLEKFKYLADRTQGTFLSLQKGYGSEQLGSCSFRGRFVKNQSEINDILDFLETAAMIAICDLVITSDTSVAHLSGGMGVPTWVLLHKTPDWRWGLEGDTTFWYPSMRLFRQKELGNWDEVMQRVAKVLQELFPIVATTESANSEKKHKSILPTEVKRLPQIQAPISIGELIDKITILKIKIQHLQGAALGNAQKELTALQEILDALNLQIDPNLIKSLEAINITLWKIEDEIRTKERDENFGEPFIQLARSVYQQNDRRAAIKKAINVKYGSALIEEKVYQEY